SPKQLGEVLFERLGLPVIRKTKTGYSTDADVLDKLSGKHEIIEQISNYRMLTKLKSTYIDGLLPVINPADGRIHSKFNQTVAATGRISSTEPNLQNIPVRTEIGSQMRKMFVAGSDEYTLLDADYSQIELRILAHISGDKVLTDAFINGDDIHTITASQVFHVEPSEVTPQMRSSAKAVNFGIIYGISDFALAGDLHVTKKTAGEYIAGYLEKYQGVRKYMADTVNFAKENGYVSTIFNRRRDIPELKSQKFAERSFGERVALNMPIQGSSADIIKLAMVKVHEALIKGGYKSRLILQVHDELIVEAHKDEIKEVTEILKNCMEGAASLSVPIPVDVGEGDTWYDAK
ncbi:MAG: DNA polymerase, partial [Monoglobales bacterium]